MKSGFPLPGQGNFCWAQLIDSPRNGLSIHVFPLLQYGNGHPNTALLPVRNRKGPTSHSRTSPSSKSYYIMKTYFDLPPVTKTLIFVIGTVYLLGLFFAPLKEWMFENLALFSPFQSFPFLGNHFRLWQPFTFMFVDSSIVSVGVDVFLLWTFGTKVEKTLGSTFFAIFVFVCGLGTAFSLFIINHFFGLYHTRFIYGCGGFCMATFIAFAWLNPDHRILLVFPPMNHSAKWTAVIVFIITILLGLLPNSEIAAWPTLGTMVTGLICMYVWRLWYRYCSSFDDYDDEADDYESYEIK